MSIPVPPPAPHPPMPQHYDPGLELPPPPHQLHQHPQAPPGAIPVDQWHQQNPYPHPPHHDPGFVEVLDPLDWDDLLPPEEFDEPPKDKKDKKKDDKKTDEKPKDPGPVEPAYAAWVLQKAPGESGTPASWTKVLHQRLHYSNEKLEKIIKSRSLSGPSYKTTTFSSLSTNQQNVVNRLLDNLQDDEKHPRAQWVVANVQRDGISRAWGTKFETKKIQVILRRVDKTPPARKPAGPAKPVYPDGELIDLSKPRKPPKPEEKKEEKKDDKKKSKDKHPDDDIMYVEDPRFLHYEQHPPPHQMHHPHFQPQHQFHPQPQWPPNFPHDHPFAPHQPHLLPPNEGPWIPPHPRDNQPEQHASRPRTPRRRESSHRRMHQIEDEMAVINHRLNALDMGSEPTNSEPSLYSPRTSNASFTPPSTPPPRGSLHRRMSSSGADGGRRRDSRYIGNGRRYRDREVEIVPGGGGRDGRRMSMVEYSRPPPAIERRHSTRRPMVHRHETRDDYPLAEAWDGYEEGRRGRREEQQGRERRWDQRPGGIYYS